MNRPLRRATPAVSAGLALLLSGCGGSETIGPAPEPPGRVASLLRVEVPGENVHVTSLRLEPDLDRGESGTWLADYADPSRFEIEASAWSVGRDTGTMFPIVVRLNGGGSPGSLLVSINASLGTIQVFGLRKHDVWIEIDVHEAAGPAGS